MGGSDATGFLYCRSMPAPTPENPNPTPAPGSPNPGSPSPAHESSDHAPGRGFPAYPPYRRWVFALAVLLVVNTFLIVLLGGHVTSKDAGMAVPDGFTTFGVWSLIAPLETWWYDEGTRLEHSHRLMGYLVGFSALAFLAAVWITQGPRTWVKGLAVGLIVMVVAQAVMGIVRVDEISLFWAGVHGVFGQVFLGVTVLAAAAVGRFWMSRPTLPPDAEDQVDTEDVPRHRRTLRVLPLVLLLALFVQLVLGSAVRHSGSALAIPDWPGHYGQVIPPMDQAAIDGAVAAVPTDQRAARFAPATVDEQGNLLPGGYAAWQVHLHFTHRLGGYAIFVLGLGYVAWLWRRHDGKAGASAVLIPATLLGALLVVQVVLGVSTVLSGENPGFATWHQTVGALLIATATWLTIRLHLVACPTERPAHIPVAAGDAMTERFRQSDAPPDAPPDTAPDAPGAGSGAAPAEPSPAETDTNKKPEPTPA